MIIEGLVTSTNADGSTRLAPMGPRMAADGRSFLLRPFPTSKTGQNLLRTREGVFHITDDVGLFARAAVGEASLPPVFPARVVSGAVLADCCRWLEFRIVEIDTRGERLALTAEIVREERLRDMPGFNRARHAVLEAAILATRLHILPSNEVAREIARMATIVDKTGGETEREAWEFIAGYIGERLGL